MALTCQGGDSPHKRNTKKTSLERLSCGLLRLGTHTWRTCVLEIHAHHILLGRGGENGKNTTDMQAQKQCRDLISPLVPVLSSTQVEQYGTMCNGDGNANDSTP